MKQTRTPESRVSRETVKTVIGVRVHRLIAEYRDILAEGWTQFCPRTELCDIVFQYVPAHRVDSVLAGVECPTPHYIPDPDVLTDQVMAGIDEELGDHWHQS